MRRTAVIIALATLLTAAAGCGRSGTTATTSSAGAVTTSTAVDKCHTQPLTAGEIGVTATTITVDVMADVGSQLAPGLFKGNWDGVDSWAKYVNAHGGLACRKVIVHKIDSALDPSKATNGNALARKEALAFVGSNTLFNPRAADNAKCKDSTGAPTGLPDIAALTNDVNQLCNSTTFVIQSFGDHCPIVQGPRAIDVSLFTWKYYVKQLPGVHGLFLGAGDLPTTLQAGVQLVEGAKVAGVKWDVTTAVSGSLPQPGYDKFIQLLRTHHSNFVYDGSNDAAMIKFRKEAHAQGIDNDVKIWACTLACYTQNLLKAGSDLEGTYVILPFLPFEEASLNADDQAYLDGVGGIGNSSSWGAQGFQAGEALRVVVDKIVAADGPNGVTRAKILAGLAALNDFDSFGWIGKKSLRGGSPCLVIARVHDGKFVRELPSKPGTFDCTDKPVTMHLDTVAGAAQIK